VGAARAEKLIDLARSREPGDREQLLLSVVDLCNASPESGRPELKGLIDDVFMALVVEAEREIRKVLAQKLARADWAPAALINVLALDDIEIARPVILASPLMQDKDLIRLLVEATIEHQIEVARRPNLGGAVVEAILEAGEPAVMTALANNVTAQVSEEAMRRLVEAARRVASLRSPLVRHPKLSKELAEQLYGWVGEALKAAISDRFDVDGPRLDEAVAQSVNEAQSQRWRPRERPFVVERDGEREEMETRLIAKLRSANQLRPGYLLRALKEGKFSLFQGALATLGEFEVLQVRRACAAPDPEPLALACAAVGIDRSVFPSLLVMVRELNGGRPGGDGEAGRRASAAFSRDPASATSAFRKRVGGV
jgi:uncharacterized protein (DUF2336 family)